MPERAWGFNSPLAHNSVGSCDLGGSELTAAVRAGKALTTAAPFRESGYRLLMRALSEQGNQAEALTVYDTLRVTLRDELGVNPSPATQQLYAELNH